MCAADFRSGKAHFKNKFCPRCRDDGLEVPCTRIRALTIEQRQNVFNSLQSGFWKRAPHTMGGREVRVVNNTITCDGPWLAVFRDAPPPSITFEPMPSKWVHNGAVRLVVAKGTLVPATEIHTARRSWLPFAESIAKRRRRLGPRGGSDGHAARDASASMSIDAVSVNDEVSGPSLDAQSISSRDDSRSTSVGAAPGSPSRASIMSDEASGYESVVLSVGGETDASAICVRLIAAHEQVISILQAGLTSASASSYMYCVFEQQLATSLQALNEARGLCAPAVAAMPEVSRNGLALDPPAADGLMHEAVPPMTVPNLSEVSTEETFATSCSADASMLRRRRFSEVRAHSQPEGRLSHRIVMPEAHEGERGEGDLDGQSSKVRHFSQTIEIFGKRKSDGHLLSTSSRHESLTSILRRLFIGK